MQSVVHQAGAGPSLPRSAAGLAPRPPADKALAASALKRLTCAVCANSFGRSSLLEHLLGRSHDKELRQRMRTLVGAMHGVTLTCLLAAFPVRLRGAVLPLIYRCNECEAACAV